MDGDEVMDIITLALAKKYVKDTLTGTGALQGQDGKSAYEIAVQNGFSGTVTQWLTSLKGEKGDSGNAEIIADISGYNPILLWSGLCSAGGSAYSSQSISSFSQFIIVIGDIYCIGLPDTNGNIYAIGGYPQTSSGISLCSALLSLDSDDHTIKVIRCKGGAIYSNTYCGTINDLGVKKIYGIIGVDKLSQSVNGQTNAAISSIKSLLEQVSQLLKDGNSSAAATAIDQYLDN